MFLEEAKQQLDEILNDPTLNPDGIRIQISHQNYARYLVYFGSLVNDLIKVGITMGKAEIGNIPVSKIWLKFQRANPNSDGKDFEYALEMTHKDNEIRKGKIKRTAIVKITFKENKN